MGGKNGPLHIELFGLGRRNFNYEPYADIKPVKEWREDQDAIVRTRLDRLQSILQDPRIKIRVIATNSSMFSCTGNLASEGEGVYAILMPQIYLANLAIPDAFFFATGQHEIGHALYTDFGLVDRLCSHAISEGYKRDAISELHNAIEDARIERLRVHVTNSDIRKTLIDKANKYIVPSLKDLHKGKLFDQFTMLVKMEGLKSIYGDNLNYSLRRVRANHRVKRALRRKGMQNALRQIAGTQGNPSILSSSQMEKLLVDVLWAQGKKFLGKGNGSNKPHQDLPEEHRKEEEPEKNIPPIPPVLPPLPPIGPIFKMEGNDRSTNDEEKTKVVDQAEDKADTKNKGKDDNEEQRNAGEEQSGNNENNEQTDNKEKSEENDNEENAEEGDSNTDDGGSMDQEGNGDNDINQGGKEEENADINSSQEESDSENSNGSIDTEESNNTRDENEEPDSSTEDNNGTMSEGNNDSDESGNDKGMQDDDDRLRSLPNIQSLLQIFKQQQSNQNMVDNPPTFQMPSPFLINVGDDEPIQVQSIPDSSQYGSGSSEDSSSQEREAYNEKTVELKPVIDDIKSLFKRLLPRILEKNEYMKWSHRGRRFSGKRYSRGEKPMGSRSEDETRSLIVQLIVDVSGSMYGSYSPWDEKGQIVSTNTRIQGTLSACIALCEAAKDFPEIHIEILAFDDGNITTSPKYDIKPFGSKINFEKLVNIGDSKRFGGGTNITPAIEAAIPRLHAFARRMRSFYGQRVQTLSILITDSDTDEGVILKQAINKGREVTKLEGTAIVDSRETTRDGIITKVKDYFGIDSLVPESIAQFPETLRKILERNFR